MKKRGFTLIELMLVVIIIVVRHMMIILYKPALDPQEDELRFKN